MADEDERAEPEILGDEPQGLVAEACKVGLEASVELVHGQGGSVLAGFTMVLAVAQAADTAPDNGEVPKASAGMWLMVDKDDGPSDPREFLDFLLAGARMFAETQGIPFAQFDMPQQQGQG